MHKTFLGRELHGIAQEIQQHLVQPHTVAINFLRKDIADEDIEFLPVRLDLRTYDIAHGLHGLAEGKRLHGKHHLAAFDLRHVQHVIDQAQQLLSCQRDLAQAVLHASRIIHMAAGDARHADDRVHRRADIVAHVGKELALRPVGGLRILPRTLRIFPRTDCLVIGRLRLHESLLGLKAGVLGLPLGAHGLIIGSPCLLQQCLGPRRGFLQRVDLRLRHAVIEYEHHQHAEEQERHGQHHQVAARRTHIHDHLVHGVEGHDGDQIPVALRQRHCQNTAPLLDAGSGILVPCHETDGFLVFNGCAKFLYDAAHGLVQPYRVLLQILEKRISRQIVRRLRHKTAVPADDVEESKGSVRIQVHFLHEHLHGAAADHANAPASVPHGIAGRDVPDDDLPPFIPSAGDSHISRLDVFHQEFRIPKGFEGDAVDRLKAPVLRNERAGRESLSFCARRNRVRRGLGIVQVRTAVDPILEMKHLAEADIFDGREMIQRLCRDSCDIGLCHLPYIRRGPQPHVLVHGEKDRDRHHDNKQKTTDNHSPCLALIHSCSPCFHHDFKETLIRSAFP